MELIEGGKIMKKNFLKNIIGAGFVGSLMLFSPFPQAEAGVVTDRFPIQMYVDRQLNTYNHAGDSRRAGWADANNDLIRVYSVSNGWARISHPGSSGRTVNRYCRVNELFADPNYSNRSARVKGAQSAYRTSSGSATIGSVSNNEEVIVLADNGRRAQIIYRLDNGSGYKIGWVPSGAVAASVPMPVDGRMKGDVNGDGKVDRNDYDLLQRYYMGSVNSIPCPKNADLNGDGRHTLTDVTQLQIMIDRSGHDPKGSFESYGTLPNQLRVIGYAYDEDNMNHKVKVHVYIDGTAGNSNVPSYEIRANKYHGRYNGHGFDDTITVPTQWCGRRTVRLYALNDVGGGTYKEIGTKIIDIPASANNNGLIVKSQYNVNVSPKSKENLPHYENKVGSRSSNVYNSVIDQFNVTSNNRYRRTSSATYCNIFAWDVMSAMNVVLPHWIKNNAPANSTVRGAYEINVNSTCVWMNNYARQYGWRTVNASEAQSRANSGYPTIAIWKNPSGKSGHIAVVRPEGNGYSYSSSKGPVIAQAGANNYNCTNVSGGFGSSKMNAIVYWTHD